MQKRPDKEQGTRAITMREIAEANERKYNPQGLPDDQKDRDEEVERGLWAFRSGMFGMVFDDDFMPSSTIDQC